MNIIYAYFGSKKWNSRQEVTSQLKLYMVQYLVFDPNRVYYNIYVYSIIVSYLTDNPFIHQYDRRIHKVYINIIVTI